MARLLKTRGEAGGARLLIADSDGLIRDGATLRIRGADRVLGDGDMILFRHSHRVDAGINVTADRDGLCAFVSFKPWNSLRIGLEPKGDGVYAFRPAPAHMEMHPELRSDGPGARK